MHESELKNTEAIGSAGPRFLVRAAALALVVTAVTVLAWLRLRGTELPGTSDGLIALIALGSSLGGLRVGLLGGGVVALWLLLARSAPGEAWHYASADRVAVAIELGSLVVAVRLGRSSIVAPCGCAASGGRPTTAPTPPSLEFARCER
jgi:fermentation-respiration switch protein FrsA (DUF1100 family)